MNAKLRRVATEVLWHFSEVVRPTDDVRSRDDTVAKVFSGQRTKIIKTADAFRRRRREGPHRLRQKRPRTFVSGLASIAAVETSKHQLSRDFQRRSIFDFCNSIGTKRTCRLRCAMSALRGKAENICSHGAFPILTRLGSQIRP